MNITCIKNPENKQFIIEEKPDRKIKYFDSFETLIKISAFYNSDILILPIEKCIEEKALFEKTIKILPNAIIIFSTKWQNKAAGTIIASKYEFIDENNPTEAEKIIKNYTTNKRKNKIIAFKTMPYLKLYINGKEEELKGRKTKELLAILIDNNGTPVNKRKLTEILWPEYEDNFSVLRNTISKINRFFEQHGIPELIKRQGDSRYINKKDYTSDISDIFDKLEGIEKYEGKYLEEFKWNKDTKKILDNLKQNLKNSQK